MKKLISMAIGLAMAFSLCACAQLDAIRNTELPPLPTREPIEESSSEKPEKTADEPEKTVIPQSAEKQADSDKQDASVTGRATGAALGDRVIIYAEKTEEKFEAPSGTLILSFSYVTPTVRIDEREQAANAINEQLHLLDELYISGSPDQIGKNQLLENALDNYTYVQATGAALNTVFSSARTVKNTRADGSVISFRYWKNVYTGGNSGEHGYMCINFDAQTGQKLTLDALSSNPDELRNTITEQLIAQARESELYAQISGNDRDPDSALAAIVREDAWLFTAEGLAFYPGFGELVPDEEGFSYPILTVPYNALSNVLDERYLPVNREGSAQLEAVSLKDVEDGTVHSIDRLVVSDGEELYLKINGTAYDVAVSSFYTVDQGEGEDRFYESNRHWYASFMSDCALQLCTTVPNGMPDLMITYTDADYAAHRYFLSRNGVKGELVLVDDSIQAVG